MITKTLEIRDRATFIPALAIEVSGSDGYLLRRAGFVSPLVILIHLQAMHCAYDPYDWGNRTMQQAHIWIAQNYHSLNSGDVVDVEFILGETKLAKVSEREGD